MWLVGRKRKNWLQITIMIINNVYGFKSFSKSSNNFISDVKKHSKNTGNNAILSIALIYSLRKETLQTYCSTRLTHLIIYYTQNNNKNGRKVYVIYLLIAWFSFRQQRKKEVIILTHLYIQLNYHIKKHRRIQRKISKNWWDEQLLWNRYSLSLYF